MFDDDQNRDAECGFGDVSRDEKSSRQQYTLKNVEADTIQLMREAASEEGMKIGSWVSLRMKEAAERALEARRIEREKRPSDQAIASITADLFALIEAQRREADARFKVLERELHELTSGQRSILSALINRAV